MGVRKKYFVINIGKLDATHQLETVKDGESDYNTKISK